MGQSQAVFGLFGCETRLVEKTTSSTVHNRLTSTKNALASGDSYRQSHPRESGKIFGGKSAFRMSSIKST